jgi:hypothetical protein
MVWKETKMEEKTRPKEKKKGQIYHVGNHMASPQKQGERKIVIWQWTKKSEPSISTEQRVRYRGATPTPVEDMRIPVLGFVI